MAEDKIVIFDDDPTGIQTVHDTIAYTSFDEATLLEAFRSPYRIVFLSTNSRAMSPEKTKSLHTELMNGLFRAKEQTGIDFRVISRGDSTLRGHYPLESETILLAYTDRGYRIDGEVICPFLEGIRKTENDIHYVKTSDGFVKCGDSEFAKDPTFGYKSSNIRDYVAEKYGAKKDCLSIPLGLERSEIVELLKGAENGVKIIVNALCERDVQIAADAIHEAEASGKRFTFRTAATFVKCYAAISDKPYLSVRDLLLNNNGKVLMAGSYVGKTSLQLDHLKKNVSLKEIVFELDGDKDQEYYASLIDEAVSCGEDVLIYTSRTLKKFSADPEKQLSEQKAVSARFTGILSHLKVRPALVIAKGGITSYDVLSHGLMGSRFYVLGQIENAVPVVRLLDGPFEGLSVVVFPGNVGEISSLTSIMK